MAKVEKLVPFILRWESGVIQKDGESNEGLFARARLKGWSDKKSDRGGKTMCGVTLTTYKEYCRRKGYPVPTAERLKGISYAQWLDILKSMYWDRWKADRIVSQSVANMLVDYVWGSGVYGIKKPQRLLGVTVDGIVGEKTLAAVNSRDARTLFGELRDLRIEHFKAIVASDKSQEVNLQGWLNRVNDMKFEG